MSAHRRVRSPVYALTSSLTSLSGNISVSLAFACHDGYGKVFPTMWPLRSGVVRRAAERAWRSTRRYPDDGEAWLLSAIPAAGDVFHGEEEVDHRPTPANQADGRRSGPDHAGRR